MNKNQKIYKFGYVLRLAGIIGLACMLIVSIPGGGWGILLFFGTWYITFPSLLALAIGHYLAGNFKDN